MRKQSQCCFAEVAYLLLTRGLRLLGLPAEDLGTCQGDKLADGRACSLHPPKKSHPHCEGI